MRCTVVRAQNLPAVNRKESCDPYVSIRLEPDLVFPLVKPQCTTITQNNISPEYHEMFEL
jgi:hypothetical protein